jgi:hypothetical protein
LEKSRAEDESFSERQKKQNMRTDELQSQATRLASLLVKEGKDGKTIQYLVNMISNARQEVKMNSSIFDAVDCDYNDLMTFDISGKEILVVRKELERRSQTSSDT